MSEHQDRKYNINWYVWHLKDKQNIIFKKYSVPCTAKCQKIKKSWYLLFVTILPHHYGWLSFLMTFLGHKLKDQHPKLATTFDQENGLNHLQNHTALTKT